MSVSYNRRKKEKKATRSEHQKTTAQKIRDGILPKFHFARDGKGKITDKLLSTYNVLTKEEKKA